MDYINIIQEYFIILSFLSELVLVLHLGACRWKHQLNWKKKTNLRT